MGERKTTEGSEMRIRSAARPKQATRQEDHGAGGVCGDAAIDPVYTADEQRRQLWLSLGCA